MRASRFIPGVLAVAGLLVCVGPACGHDTEVVRSDGRVWIVDETGKKWEVTHAESAFGFDPASFQFGLGPHAIPPLNDPRFVSSGDAGYPSPTSPMRVLATTIDGESRAYPIGRLGRWEVVNDWFGAVPVAPAY